MQVLPASPSEIRAQWELKHSNIIGLRAVVFDAESGTLYLMYEYEELEHLAHIMNNADRRKAVLWSGLGQRMHVVCDMAHVLEDLDCPNGMWMLKRMQGASWHVSFEGWYGMARLTDLSHAAQAEFGEQKVEKTEEDIDCEFRCFGWAFRPLVERAWPAAVPSWSA